VNDMVLVTVPPTDVVTLIGPVVALAGTFVVILLAVSFLMTAAVPLKLTSVAPYRLVPLMVAFFPAVPFPGVTSMIAIGVIGAYVTRRCSRRPPLTVTNRWRAGGFWMQDLVQGIRRISRIFRSGARRGLS
jgi:hypothetical protein